MAWRSSGHNNQQLANNLKKNGIIKSDRIHKAFSRVDRGIFVPAEPDQPAGTVNESAYSDRPVRIGGVHLSAPHMYAHILEALDIQRGQSILNLGSGSGYLSCLMSTLCGIRGFSIGVERNQEVVKWARQCTAKCIAQQPVAVASQLKKPASRVTGTGTAASDTGKQPAITESIPVAAAAAGNSGSAAAGSAPVSTSSKLITTASAPHKSDSTTATATAAPQPPPSNPAPPPTPGTASSVPVATPAPPTQSGAGRGGDPMIGQSLLARMFGVPDSIVRLMTAGTGTGTGAAGGGADSDDEDDPFKDDDYGRDTKSTNKASGGATATAAAVASASGGDRKSMIWSSAEIDAAAEAEEAEEEGLMCESTYVVGDVFLLEEKQNLTFDRIYVGAAAPPLRKTYFTQLLRPGGVLVAPFGDELIKITRRPNNELSTSVLARVAFAPLILPPKSELATLKPIILPEPVFDPSLHQPWYSDSFHKSVDSLLMLQRRPVKTGGQIARLPRSVLLSIVEYCNRDWFYREPTEVELLKSLLAAETKARESAEARANKAERERDEAMLMCMLLRTRVQRPANRRGESDDDDEHDEVGGGGGGGGGGGAGESEDSADSGDETGAAGNSGSGSGFGSGSAAAPSATGGTGSATAAATTRGRGGGSTRGRARTRGGGGGGGGGGGLALAIDDEEVEFLATVQRVVSSNRAGVAGSSVSAARNSDSNASSGGAAPSPAPAPGPK